MTAEPRPQYSMENSAGQPGHGRVQGYQSHVRRQTEQQAYAAMHPHAHAGSWSEHRAMLQAGAGPTVDGVWWQVLAQQAAGAVGGVGGGVPVCAAAGGESRGHGAEGHGVGG